MIKRLLVGVSFLMLGAFGLQAQSSSTQTGSQSGSQYGSQQSGAQGDSSQATSNQLSKTDQDFVLKAYQSNLNEIELSQLASQKSSNSDVKQFAQQMVDDHTKANDQLRQIADRKGISLPSSTSHNANVNRFQNLSGSTFDRQYIQNQMQAHRQAVSMFQNEANNTQDPDLKSFASTQLSNLQQHESKVNELHSKVASARSNQPGNLPRSSSSSSSDNSSDQAQSANPPSDSSDTSNYPTDTTAKDSNNGQLPRTASNIPLVGLFGFMLLGAAIILRSFRSLRNNQ